MVLAVSANSRAAAVQLLQDFAQDTGLTVQIYRARPIRVKPPTAFVDRMADRLVDFIAPAIFQHTTTVQVVVLHGLFDQGDTVDQRDRFVDAFLDWVRTRFHAAGANSLIAVSTVEDDPTYVPEWLPESERKPYFASLISLEVGQTD